MGNFGQDSTQSVSISLPIERQAVPASWHSSTAHSLVRAIVWPLLINTGLRPRPSFTAENLTVPKTPTTDSLLHSLFSMLCKWIRDAICPVGGFRRRGSLAVAGAPAKRHA